jgi:hypothetical protein
MNNIRLLLLVVLPLAVLPLWLTSSCGSGSTNRQLQSISIAVSPDIGQYSFIATGTYNAPPITVSPLAASWYTIDPSGAYTLTTQPFTACSLPHGTTVTAMAPANPNAPSTGSVSSTKMVQANAVLDCP